MQRSNLVRAFAFEGALYALAASAVGSVAGVGVGWVMVRFLGKGVAGGSEDFRIVFAASPRNMVLAFCMGMVLTFAVVLLSSWRVSRLNVVRAMRDIPEPDREGRTVLGVLVAVILPLLGAVAFWQGLVDGDDGLLPRRDLAGPDRVGPPCPRPRSRPTGAFTASGLALLALWLTPASITTPAGMAGDRRCSSSLVYPSSWQGCGS